MADIISEYKSKGFVHLKNAITKSCLDAYVDAYAKILRQQLEKLGTPSNSKSKIIDAQGAAEYVDALVMELDSVCRPALNEASTMARNTLSGHRLASEAALVAVQRTFCRLSITLFISVMFFLYPSSHL